MAQGCATVGWDDEGIAAQNFPLVKDGVVVDYATSRQFVSELAPWYKQHGVPVHSNGCAASESALTLPTVYRPNLVLHPAAHDTSLDELIAGIDNGILVCGGKVSWDMQYASGRGTSDVVCEIKNGKRGLFLDQISYLIRSLDLWKNFVALGGASTAVTKGLVVSKGEPNQMTMHSVQAVAARFKGVQFNNSRQV
jgi:TldD protein